MTPKKKPTAREALTAALTPAKKKRVTRRPEYPEARLHFQLAQAQTTIDQLAAVTKIAAEQHQTISENAKVVVELNEKLSIAQMQADRRLRDIHDQVDARRKERAEAQAEIEYWKGEVTRLHGELIDIQREAARDGVG